nr:hypothetical protein [Nonlabens ulvanivorans]|tara:strand:+ start:409 stop:690 length:282 start_codon:yes stop_codon:yes gene_type:complete
MIFLIHKVNSYHQVTVYENISDLTQRLEWQDIFEGKSIIIDKNGIEYEWDSTKSDEIGSIHEYTLISTTRVSKLIIECLKRVKANKDICEFTF